MAIGVDEKEVKVRNKLHWKTHDDSFISMMGNNRRDRGALIALGLSLSAVVLVVWLSQPSGELVAQSYTSITELPQEYHGPAEGRWWPELAARDSYAQWIMAILSAVATGVSIWAVILVRDTLVVTRNAVADTRQIGEAQTRAYLVGDGGTFTLNPRSFTYSIRLKNVGQSPAKMIRARLVLDLPVGQYERVTAFRSRRTYLGAIMAGSVGEMTFLFNDADNPGIPVFPPTADQFPAIPSDVGALLRSGERKHVAVRCGIVWTDVFDRSQTHWFGLNEGNSETFEAFGSLCRKGEFIHRGTESHVDKTEPPLSQ